MKKQNPQKLQKKINFNFKNPDLLEQALVHRSAINETGRNRSNERLEFLGDAVLELWVSNYLFKNFKNFPEGRLTNLRSLVVCTGNLKKTAKNLNLGQFLYLSRGEEANDGRQNPSILADSLEALIGAIYLDQGLSAVDQFLKKHLTPSIKKIEKLKNYKDPKSVFQEIAQAQKGITPHYQTLKETGPDHNKTFTVAVFLADQQIATGTGNSKQKAEEAASRKATKMLENTI